MEKFRRIVAIVLLIVPGISAVYGFCIMRDTLFDYFSSHGNENLELVPNFQWLKMIFGIMLFVMGISFIAGWTYYRDRKRGYVLSLNKKKPKLAKPTN